MTHQHPSVSSDSRGSGAAQNAGPNLRLVGQGLVLLTSGRWEVMSLQEAVLLMYARTALSIYVICTAHDELKHLPTEARNALSIAGIKYDDEYALHAKTRIVTRSTNATPATEPGGE